MENKPLIHTPPPAERFHPLLTINLLQTEGPRPEGTPAALTWGALLLPHAAGGEEGSFPALSATFTEIMHRPRC